MLINHYLKNEKFDVSFDNFLTKKNQRLPHSSQSKNIREVNDTKSKLMDEGATYYIQGYGNLHGKL